MTTDVDAIAEIVAAGTMLEVALAYAAQGLAVFPLHNPLPDGACSCGNSGCGKTTGKHPRTANGVKAATTEPEQIREWWTQWPDANIGIATGAISGVMVIDVDGVEGEESLRRMTEEHGPLPATRAAKTGSGRHLYFKHPGGKIKSKAPISRGYPHVDSRGDGGYVVAPPSLHRSGVRYAVDATMPQTLSDAPSWLIDLVNAGEGSAKIPSVTASNAAIIEGGRNSTLASKAGKMRRDGMTAEAIAAALLVTNRQDCDPPLPDDEVLAIARSISSYPPASSDDVLLTLTDAGNAKRFARQWGERVRYVPEWKKWLIWRDTRWQTDTTGEVMEMAKQTAYDIYQEGDAVSGDARVLIARHSKASQAATKLEAMLKLARSIPELVVPAAKLDADPWLLGVGNGTIDLRTGRLRPASREDYITTAAPVTFDPEATCPQFLRFLSSIMSGDELLVQYLQRIVGYALTGTTSEQCLFFLYGTGANGKSTLLNAIKSLLGGALCQQTPQETIMARMNKSGANHDLAHLKGARVVMTNEMEDGSHLAESLIKLMTGEDTINARHLYQESFEYVPRYKLFIAGNHKPVIRGDDVGIWRRIQLIPFEVTIPADARDVRLAEKLRGEVPGILNWALEGCSSWQERGLDSPPAVLNAVAEYKEDMDIIGQWITDCCDTGDDITISSSSAYESYTFWAIANGHKRWSHKVFGRKLKERFPHERKAAGVMFAGLGAKGGGSLLARQPLM